MSQEQKIAPTTNHRRFAAYYERTSHSASERTILEPLRKEVVGQARGLVLEVGAGNGLNFAHYDPARVERVEATEPDDAMLSYARKRTGTSPVPITLTPAPVEHLPFADATFDSVVCTLVFCSVNDPRAGLQEIQRVLKPGGQLLMLEHVRSQHRLAAIVQDLITPLTRTFLGNCRWNRDTLQTAHQSGFQKVEFERRTPVGALLPIVLLVATR